MGPLGAAGVGEPAPGDPEGVADGSRGVTTGDPSAFAVWTALIATDTAFDVVPRTGIAPFSNWEPSAGESRLSVGASMTRKGTVMNTRSVFSDGLPVSGSSALMSNWLRPRRSSTSAVQRPSSSAVTRYGCSRPAASTVIVAPAIEVPRSRKLVVSSFTSMTACGGFVSASVGGFANRTSCTPMYTANTAIRMVSSAATMITGEKVRPCLGAASGLGTDEGGLRGHLGVATLAAPLADHVIRIEAQVQRVVAQEALRVDGSRQLGVLAVLERREVAGADLRVPLRTVQVNALALAGSEQALRQQGAGLLGVRSVAIARIGADPSDSISRRHPPSSSSTGPGPSARRRTTRAFEPSNLPTYPRASSWSMIRAARA